MSFRTLTNKIPGKLKGLFFYLRVDRIIPIHLLLFTGHMAELSRWIAKNKKEGHHDFYIGKFEYERREKMFEKVIQDESLDTNVDYFEFGVSKGGSFRWWVNRLKNENANFYGFDTFSGLPEDWGLFKKGDMDNGNEPPIIDDKRHTFYQGLFQQTLLPFLSEYNSNQRKIIHMDADLYSATLYVLTLMTPYLKTGDIIFFDEFNVPMHEYKALKDWSSAFYVEFELLGSVNNFYQLAIKIK